MNSRPRKLLFIVNDVGFFLSHRLNIAQGAQGQGWEVHVATPVGEELHSVEGFGFRHHRIALSRSGTNPAAELRTLLHVWKVCRTVRPDIVHAVTIKPVIYSGLVARLVGVPCLVQAVSGLGHVFVAKGLLARIRRRLVVGAYRRAFSHPRSVVIFQNPDDKEALSGLLEDAQGEIVPGSGVDPAEFQVRPEPDGAPLVILASRMLWDKGVGDFVSAAKLLRAKGVSARYALVGGIDAHNPAGVPESQLKEWADEGAIEWWGRRDDMPEVMAAAAIVCLPTYYGEGIPRVLIEAAAAGRPIVATDWPGCREIVADGENGRLVPPRDPRRLAEALEQLLADQTTRQAMGACGRAKVLAGYTSDQVVKMTLEIYDRLWCNASVSVAATHRYGR